MKKGAFLLLPAIIFFLLAGNLQILKAHPGNTAADGCHYCRTNCAKWGEVEGERHCHGGPAIVQSTSTPTPTKKITPTFTPKPTNTPTITDTAASTSVVDDTENNEDENVLGVADTNPQIPTPTPTELTAGDTALGLSVLSGILLIPGIIIYRIVRKFRNKGFVKISV
jgi:hypothetical protein